MDPCCIFGIILGGLFCSFISCMMCSNNEDLCDFFCNCKCCKCCKCNKIGNQSNLQQVEDIIITNEPAISDLDDFEDKNLPSYETALNTLLENDNAICNQLQILPPPDYNILY